MTDRRSPNKHPHPDYAIPIQVTRFWKLVKKSSVDQCWEWLGDTDKNGYGIFVFMGKRRGAHELALSFTTGEKRFEGYVTRHSCDNPICCNPEHLQFGTPQENVSDMLTRGRSANWTRSSNKLTPQLVEELRIRRDNGAPQSILAKQYGVSEAYVSEIVRGLTWKDAPGPIQTKNNMYKKVG